MAIFCPIKTDRKLQVIKNSSKWTIFGIFNVDETFYVIFKHHGWKLIKNSGPIFSELFKSKTLEFFSKTLPILKADDTLPKVARYEDNHITHNPTLFNSKPGSRITFYHHRTKRAAEKMEETEPELEDPSSEKNEGETSEDSRQARGFCKDSYGVFCMLYNALSGNKDKAADRMGGDEDIPSVSAMNSLDSPMTPCPSAVEYVTPVFAKNYQGVWRYVVQIPYEGYFTQTVEVVKCL